MWRLYRLPGAAEACIAVWPLHLHHVCRPIPTFLKTSLARPPAVSALAAAALLALLAGLPLAPAARAQTESPAPSSDDGMGGDTAVGNGALPNLSGGDGNTALGFEVLSSNTTGFENTGSGYIALQDNTTGIDNTAYGTAALNANETGNYNTACGADALQDNTTGGDNTACGAVALSNNNTGGDNTACGVQAMQQNTTGSNNTAGGFGALRNNTSGANNTAVGYKALVHNTTAANSTAVGVNALFNATTGANNIALGQDAGQGITTGSNNIDIGAAGQSADANTIRVGIAGTNTACYFAGVSGVTVASGVPVIVDASGPSGHDELLGALQAEHRADGRGQRVDPGVEARDLPLQERPGPGEAIPQFGLVAEEVEKVNPALVARDAAGQGVHRALRRRERDAAQRVLERTPPQRRKDRRL